MSETDFAVGDILKFRICVCGQSFAGHDAVVTADFQRHEVECERVKAMRENPLQCGVPLVEPTETTT